MKSGFAVAAVLTACCCCLAGCGRGAPDTLEAVKKKEKLVVAAPRQQEGDLSRSWAGSLEREVIEAMGSRLNAEIVYEYTEPGGEVQAVEDGRADIAAGAVILEDSGNDGYSVTYGCRPVYIALEADRKVISLGELGDLSVGLGPGVGKNVRSQLYAVSGMTMNDVVDAQAAKALIEEGKIAGYVCFEAEARELMDGGGLWVQELPGIRPESYAFYAGKEQYRMLGELNQLLTEKLKD